MNLNSFAAFLPVGILLVGVIVGLLFRVSIDHYVGRRDGKAHERADVVLLRLARGYVLVWCILVSATVAVAFVPISATFVVWLQRGLAAIGYASVTLFLIATSVWLIRSLGDRVHSFQPVAGMAERVTQITLAVLGLLLVLNVLTVPITPLLTTLGVAGLATALALQDTLSNFFAGFYLLADRPIRPGDFIRLDTGDEGYVVEVGWRSTRIRTLPNNVIVLPNHRVSQAIITNYSLPESRMALPIRVGVSYDSDPDHVERVLTDLAMSAVGEVDGLLAEPPPVVRFSPGFGDSSLDFTLICHVAEFVDQFRVQHEIRKRIFRRFREEKIVFPFPTRTVQLDPASIALLRSANNGHWEEDESASETVDRR